MSDEKNSGLTEQQVMEIMHRELVPVFQRLVGEHKTTHGRLEALEKDHGHTKEVAHGMYAGLMDAHKRTRKSKLSESINLDDLGDSRDMYKAHGGTDMKDDLINHILENNIPDEQLEGLLSNLRENTKQRYGGFKKVEASADPGEGPLKAVGSDKGTGELKESDEPKGKKASDDWYEKVMSQHKSMRGTKL